MIPTQVRVGLLPFPKYKNKSRQLEKQTKRLTFKINSLVIIQNDVRAGPKTVLYAVICQKMRNGGWDDLCVCFDFLQIIYFSLFIYWDHIISQRSELRFGF